MSVDSMTLFQQLWHERERLPLGSAAWSRAWAKRMQQVACLLRQGRYHARLRRAGVSVAPRTFFSDVSLISGRLQELSVGEGSFVGRAEIAVHARLSIGRCVCINDGVKILTASHNPQDPGWSTVTGEIALEDYVWVATNAIILPGVRLGRGAVVGAGAVVTRDVPPRGIVVGNPARLLDKQRSETLNYEPVQSVALFRAWNSSPRPNL